MCQNSGHFVARTRSAAKGLYQKTAVTILVVSLHKPTVALILTAAVIGVGLLHKPVASLAMCHLLALLQ